MYYLISNSLITYYYCCLLIIENHHNIHSFDINNILVMLLNVYLTNKFLKIKSNIKQMLYNIIHILYKLYLESYRHDTIM